MKEKICCFLPGICHFLIKLRQGQAKCDRLRCVPQNADDRNSQAKSVGIPVDASALFYQLTLPMDIGPN